MFKKAENGLWVMSDIFMCDLSRVKKDRKDKFIDQAHAYAEGKAAKPPRLIATVAATHAGIVTGNNTFYRPDTMRDGLNSFVEPYRKPVLLHHDDREDAIGRVQKASYRDLSNRYVEPLLAFKERYGGTTFLDAMMQDKDKAFDQVEWVMKNLVPQKDYVGLGYGELDLYISDGPAAEKILDERYLTLSVGFGTTEVYCSTCQTDWANEERCEHIPGEKYDDMACVLIPGDFKYEEVSYVNTPADSQALTLSVTEVPHEAPVTDDKAEQTQQEERNTYDFITQPILTSIGDNVVYRLDSYKKISPDRAQEVLKVDKDKKKSDAKENKPDLTKYAFGDTEIELNLNEDGLAFINGDAKREHYVTSEVDGHMHRVVIDPATGNGYCDYTDHSHDVVNKILETGGPGTWNDTTDKFEISNPHTHELDKKVDRLEDKRKCKKKKDFEGEGEDEIEIDDDADIPEGYELMEDTTEEVIDPTNFELSDLASVEAAKMAVETSDLSDSKKARTLAAISKKAKELNLDTVIEIGIVELELTDPKKEDSLKLAFANLAQFEELVKGLEDDVKEANKESLEGACSIFGVKLEDYATAAGMATAPIPIATAEAEADKKFDAIDEELIDNLIEGFIHKIGDDVKRKELGEYLVDKLISKAIIDDIFADYNDLANELKDAKEKIAQLTSSNRDFYLSKQDDLTRINVALKVALKKPGFEDAEKIDVEEKAKELKTRSVDSLQDSLTDLLQELAGAEAKPKEDGVEPVDPNDAIGDEEELINRQVDARAYSGMTDACYVVARNLESRFLKNKIKQVEEE